MHKMHNYSLMWSKGRRCHIQYSVYNFVAVSIVGDCCIVAVGPFSLSRSRYMLGGRGFFGPLGCRRHVHMAFLVGSRLRCLSIILAILLLYLLILLSKSM